MGLTVTNVKKIRTVLMKYNPRLILMSRRWGGGMFKTIPSPELSNICSTNVFPGGLVPAL